VGLGELQQREMQKLHFDAMQLPASRERGSAMSTQTYSLFAGTVARDEGMAQAAACRNPLVDKVRRHLRHLAQERADHLVTADDAYKFLDSIGENETALGNAAGSIFRSPEWEATGCWTASTRVSNHARMLRGWRLKP
jgi:hypothetical protein